MALCRAQAALISGATVGPYPALMTVPKQSQSGERLQSIAAASPPDRDAKR